MADSRRVRIVVDADVLNAIRGLREVEGGLGRVGRQGQDTTAVTSSFGEKLAQGLANVGVATGFDAIKAGFSKVVSSGLDYESNMNTLQAVTGATADQMKQVGETAKALGNDVKLPGASAQTTAAAMTELAKGGLTVSESMDAARGTMMLAAAAQIDGAQAAEIQSSALNTFGLSASEANRVADVLANTANASAGEITDFAQGMAQAGTVANSFGWSIEDTSTMLGLMANAGIKGSDAGTSLKTTMTSLLSPTEKQSAALEELGIKTQDANGKMISAQEFTSQLAAAKGRMTEAEFTAAAATAFGTDAVRTSLVAAQAGTKGFDDMSTAIRKTGGAADVAAANSVGLNGALDRINNAADTAALTLYETFSPALTGIVDFGTSAVGVLGDLAGKFGELPGPVQAIAVALGGVILLRGPLGSLWTSMGTSLAAMRTSFTTFAASLRGATGAAATFGVAAKGALSVLGGPIGLAIIGVTTALSFMTGGSEDAAVATADFSAAIDENTGKLKDNAGAIIAKSAADAGSFDAFEKVGGSVEDYTAALAGNTDAQDRVHTAILDAAEAGVRQSSVWGQVGESLERQGKTARMVASEQLALGDSGKFVSDGMTAALLASQRFASDTDSLSTSLNHARQQAESATGAVGGTASALDAAGGAATKATSETTSYSDAMKELKSATSEADAASQFLNITLLTLAGSDISAEQAARANEAAMRDVADAARNAADAHDTVTDAQTKLDEMTAHLGGTLDGEEASASNLVITQQDLDAQTRKVEDAKNREADASDNQKDAQDKAAQSARDMTAASYNSAKQTGSTEDAIKAATKTMEAQRKKFIESAVAAGVEQGAAEKLADAQGLIPKNVSTAYASPGIDEAFAKIQKVNSALASIDKKTFTANITAGYTNVEGTYTAEQQANRNKRDGGPIVGLGGSREDNIPIMASNGEFMVNAASAAKHRGTLEAINRDKFADGGLIGTQSNIGANVNNADGFVKSVWAALDKDMAYVAAAAQPAGFAGNGQWGPANYNGFAANTAAAKAYIESHFSGVSSIGGLYGGSVPGSDHPAGKALDVMIADYASQSGIAAGTRIADWFVSNPSAFGSKYVIWRDRINELNGWMPYSHPSGNNDTLQHRDHVHLSFLTGSGEFSGQPSGALGDSSGGLAALIRKNAASAMGSLFGSSGGGGGGVEQWRSTAIAALQAAGQPVGYASSLLKQMDHESSGRPGVVNTTDSNAQRGDPSIGLMQVIGETFRDTLNRHGFGAYVGKGQTDPFSNILASILYTVDRYGDLGFWARNGYGAYADGGIVPGGNTPGDDKVWAKASPGEAFLTNNQWATAKAAVQQAGRGGVGNITVNARVFVGDREITDIVRVETDTAFGEFRSDINRGRLQPTS